MMDWQREEVTQGFFILVPKQSKKAQVELIRAGQTITLVGKHKAGGLKRGQVSTQENTGNKEDDMNKNLI